MSNPLLGKASSDVNSTRSDPFTPDKPPSEDGSVVPLTLRRLFEPFQMLTKSYLDLMSNLSKTIEVWQSMVDGIVQLITALFTYRGEGVDVRP